MLSSRKDNWKHAQWQLAEIFPHYLREAPFEATRALIHILNLHDQLHGGEWPNESVDETFDFHGETASIWSGWTPSVRDEMAGIVSAFQGHLEKLLEPSVASELEVQEIIRLIVVDNRSPILW